MLTKQQVIERLCKLATKVGEDAFDNMKAHDCFCGENHLVDTPANEFRFEEDVIA